MILKTCIGGGLAGVWLRTSGGAVAGLDFTGWDFLGREVSGRDFCFVKALFSSIDVMSHFFAPFAVFGRSVLGLSRSVLGPSPWQFSESENRRIVFPVVRLAIIEVALLELAGRTCDLTSFETGAGFAVCGRLNDEIPTPWFISF